MNETNQQAIEQAVKQILTAVGEDPNRPGLLETPARVARMYAEVFSSLSEQKFTDYKIFDSDHDEDEIVLVKDIPFYSMCEHHLLPFFGTATVAYIPKDGKIIGLSKIPRLVDFVTKKPTLQENVTADIATNLADILHPAGIAVMVKARHMCMEMRGVKKANSQTRTSFYSGRFKEPQTRQDLMLQLQDI
ncbi:GTP cyclohydrolase I FolE [Agrilactobacillus fermenti]|uniref:GTP cyclohydrolase I FolE n=1 Tax=Agrilactobacillus fermenti TaxID=2586909 RepID=UPI001E3A723B|nr:GTP cyclohydrolase I FolE [Agrilactobacillus fermenti]MCD2256070.1 GTP cyclohydrolase I FolE [Agrilactobacillus fermenti]